MKNIIEIKVIGHSGSGKSTIAQEVVDALRGLNFNVKWEVPSDFDDELDARKIDQVDIENRLNAVRLKEPEIIVGEVQAARELKF
jgi:ABC-type dipeptide/oligopeptide/nickel transport system ATPase component